MPDPTGVNAHAGMFHPSPVAGTPYGGGGMMRGGNSGMGPGGPPWSPDRAYMQPPGSQSNFWNFFGSMIPNAAGYTAMSAGQKMMQAQQAGETVANMTAQMESTALSGQLQRAAALQQGEGELEDFAQKAAQIQAKLASKAFDSMETI